MSEEITQRQRGMQPLVLTLAAGVPQAFDIAGDYIHIQTASVADLTVRFDDSAPVLMFEGMGFRRYYSRVQFESATGQAIRVLVGFGSVFDARATVSSLTLNTTIAPGNTFKDGAAVTCAVSAATQLLAADADRLYALIKNPSSNTLTMWIGTSGVNNSSGYPLEPGESIPIATTAALYAYNADGALTEDLFASSVAEV